MVEECTVTTCEFAPALCLLPGCPFGIKLTLKLLCCSPKHLGFRVQIRHLITAIIFFCRFLHPLPLQCAHAGISAAVDSAKGSGVLWYPTESIEQHRTARRNGRVRLSTGEQTRVQHQVRREEHAMHHNMEIQKGGLPVRAPPPSHCNTG